ncbi:uncharacterized protein LOC134213812 isoform X1 [Armigeres subalbatus]|uniref:uncharacterized protein LOC134213812 isoform X1 n=1 Tax=Armigeres subalbatus TaxID=124917 RepID=UPI002ED1AF1B
MNSSSTFCIARSERSTLVHFLKVHKAASERRFLYGFFFFPFPLDTSRPRGVNPAVRARHYGSQTRSEAFRPTENLRRKVSPCPGGCVVPQAKASWRPVTLPEERRRQSIGPSATAPSRNSKSAINARVPIPAMHLPKSSGVPSHY